MLLMEPLGHFSVVWSFKFSTLRLSFFLFEHDICDKNIGSCEKTSWLALLPPTSSEDQRINVMHFLAGCCKMRLNQDLSLLFLCAYEVTTVWCYSNVTVIVIIRFLNVLFFHLGQFEFCILCVHSVL